MPLFSPTTTRAPWRRSMLALAIAASAMPALAQQAPLTGQRMGTEVTVPASQTPPAPAATAPMPARPLPPPPAPVSSVVLEEAPTEDPGEAGEIGSTTRAVLQMQVSGSHAGRPLPMLGDEASAAYQRYLKSFDHPIPEFFEGNLPKSRSASQGSLGN